MAVKDPNEVYGKDPENVYEARAMVRDAQENPKHIQAMKDGKAPLEYLVDFVMAGDAYVHQGGAIKYGYRNWTIDKIKASTYIAAIRRHLNAWSAGEDLDPPDKGGSGWSHLYHIRAGCAIVLDAENAGTLIDDRDRAESISQDKEDEKPAERTQQYVVRYTTNVPGIGQVPIVRTYCHGPFAKFEDAKEFALNRTPGKEAVSIDTVLSV